MGRELSTTSRLHAYEMIHVKALAGLNHTAVTGARIAQIGSRWLRVLLITVGSASCDESRQVSQFPRYSLCQIWAIPHHLLRVEMADRILPDTLSNMPTENTAYQSLGHFIFLDLVRPDTDTKRITQASRFMLVN